jgi:ribosomal protein S27AE
MKYLVILILTLVFAFECLGQADTSSTVKKTVIYDTIYIQAKPDNVVQPDYLDILEKTNQQLSLWWNPFSVLIGALGILFTILTIIAAYIIYRQSKEHKEILNESVRKNEAILNKLIEERNQQLKTVEMNLANLISESKEKLKTTTEENKNEIKELIAKLEIQKESLDSQISPVYVTPEVHDYLSTVNFMSMKNKRHKCTMCGFDYFVKNKRDDVGVSSLRTLTITCPKCGNVEPYYEFL